MLKILNIHLEQYLENFPSSIMHKCKLQTLKQMLQKAINFFCIKLCRIQEKRPLFYILTKMLAEVHATRFIFLPCKINTSTILYQVVFVMCSFTQPQNNLKSILLRGIKTKETKTTFFKGAVLCLKNNWLWKP